MQHFLVILLGLHLGIGLLLLHIGPLSDLMRETRAEGAGSAVLLGTILVMLWPCLWPTAVYRPQFRASALTFERVSMLEDQVDADTWSPSSTVLASAGRPSGDSGAALAERLR
jgi:hypothetical protein